MSFRNNYRGDTHIQKKVVLKKVVIRRNAQSTLQNNKLETGGRQSQGIEQAAQHWINKQRK